MTELSLADAISSKTDTEYKNVIILAHGGTSTFGVMSFSLKALYADVQMNSQIDISASVCSPLFQCELLMLNFFYRLATRTIKYGIWYWNHCVMFMSVFFFQTNALMDVHISKDSSR